MNREITIKHPDGLPLQANRVPNSERKTSHYMSSYEKAKIIGVRVLEFESGKRPLISVPEIPKLEQRESRKARLEPPKDKSGMYLKVDYIAIAEKELKAGLTPLYIVRYQMNGNYEVWHPAEMVIP